jgi:hypothetical protein
MSQVDKSSVHDFTTGETVTEAMLDQNTEVLRIANNDNDSRIKVLENAQAGAMTGIRSGTSFPTNPVPKSGDKFYRTDLHEEFTYTEANSWEQLAKYDTSLTLNKGFTYPVVPHLHIEMVQDYAISANTDTALYQGNFNRVTNRGNWVDSVDRWIVPIGGSYNITGFLAMSPSVNGIELRCRIFIYGSDNSVKGTYTVGTDNANNGRWVYAGGSLNLDLLQGDKIALVGSQDSTGYQTLKQGRLTALLVAAH